MEELEQYVRKTGKDRLIMLIAGLAFGGAGAILLMQEKIAFCILMFACAALLLFGALTAEWRTKQKWEKYDSDGSLARIQGDFAMAKSYADDAVRFGNEYIFRAKMMEFIRYEDVVKAEYRETADERTIDLKLKSGRRVSLCDLYNADSE